MSFFDLTFPVENGMTCYPGDPELRVAQIEVEPPRMVSKEGRLDRGGAATNTAGMRGRTDLLLEGALVKAYVDGQYTLTVPPRRPPTGASH